jgi:hypothetical protein
MDVDQGFNFSTFSFIVGYSDVSLSYDIGMPSTDEPFLLLIRAYGEGKALQ